MGKRAAMVARHEGYRKHIYHCTAGKQTIGYGFNLDKGMTEKEAELLLEHNLNLIDEQLAYSLPFYVRLSAIRQDVLCDMAYNLGLGGLYKFKKMLAALEREDYVEAASQMLDSKWADQVGKRAEELSVLMLHGADIIT